MKKTLLASALLLAFSAGAHSVEWENPVLEYDGNNDEAMNKAYTKFVKNDLGLTSGLTELKEDETGYVTSPNLRNGASINYGGAPVFLQSSDSNLKVVNNGKIWVVGGIEEEGTAYVAEGMGTSGTSTEQSVTNNGTIFVDGKNNSMAYSRIKGMSAINGKAINAGTIFVKNGGVAMLDNTATGADGTKVLQNAGTIVVQSSDALAIGIYYRKQGNADVSNNGTIYAQGESAVGVVLDADIGEQKEFTNNKAILASDGGKAIVVSDNLTQGATLNFSANSQVDGLVDANSNTILNFTGNTDTIELADDAQAINVDSASNITIRQGTDTGLDIDSVTTAQGGSTSFELTRLGTTGDEVLAIGKVDGDISVGYTGDVSDDLVQGADANDLFNGILIEEGQDLTTVTVDEGAWGNALVATKDENGVHLRSTSTNSLLSSAKDVALTAALMWRSQLTNLTDRLGTLRTLPQAAGGWARYNNGRLEGRGIEHDYNTIEVGFDAPVSNNFLVGVSFDYTFGDTDIAAGTSDNDTYALGLYGTYFSESGSFLDLMAKIGRIDAEYDLDNGIHEKADYMMTGAIVGVEGGHRFDLSHNMFVEPQVQLTYSWLRASSYSTDIRTVDLETMESLIARVGFMGGVKFNENKGAAYLKASYNHDFLGDVDAKFSGVVDGNPIALGINDELDDNWGEVSLGASYNVTDSVHAFIDVGTSFGGDIDQKWRVNFGGRYVF